MKKVLLFAIIIGCIPLQMVGQDQNSSNGDSDRITVNARVVAEGIEMTTIRDMRFGKVQPGQQEISISPLRDPNAGKMVASGIPDERIRVSFLREWQLTNDQGGEPLTFSYRVAGNSIDDQNTSELLETNNRNLRFNSEGEFYFWIGGRVNISNASPGNYEGEFTIEIEYI